MATDVVIRIDSRFDDKGLKKFKKEVKKDSGVTLKNLAKGFKTLALAGGALFAGAAAGAIAFGKQSVELAKEQIRVEAQLAATLESTGQAAGLTAEEIKNMASELQNVTNFGDEATIAGQNMLLTFTNIGRDVFPRATETMLDLSTAMGQDIKTSAIQLGKALNDPIAGLGALSRVGIQFTQEQKDLVKTLVDTGQTAKAQTLILDELEIQFGGSARAAREADGGMIALKNSFGDFQEEIGKAILPTLNDSIKGLGIFLQEAQPVVTEFAENLQETLGPAMFLIEDAAIRIAKAFGIADEETTGLDLALLTLEKGLNVIVTALQAVAITAQGLAFVIEQIKEAIDIGGDLLDLLDQIGQKSFGSNFGFVGPVTNISGFADGGSFTVGGSGGTDSQLVAFNASPGERVSIATPEQQATGTGNLEELVAQVITSAMAQVANSVSNANIQEFQNDVLVPALRG